MGLDMRILKCKSKLQLTGDEIDWTQVEEVWYARKFWDMQREMSFLKDYENGDFIPLTRENLEEMLTFATHNLDYFGTFNTVIPLCNVLYNLDTWEEYGFHLYYEADW